MTFSNLARGAWPLVVVLLFGAAIAAGGIWSLFLRPSGPPPVVDLTSPAPTIAAGASAAPGLTAPGVSGAPAGSGSAPGDLAGTWKVDASIGKASDFSNSFVGYRVQEQLVNVGANTAVGRTSDVTGSMTLDGTNLTAAQFTARLASLTSDDDGRDGRVSNALNTRQFPTTTFVLGSPIQLGSLPGNGQEIKVNASGKLTIRGVTRDVVLPITAQLNGGTLTAKGAVEIKLADFGIPKPDSFLVLSIADTAVIEVQLQMTRA
jgi:polyisoprenoid-binding protein YceI